MTHKFFSKIKRDCNGRIKVDNRNRQLQAFSDDLYVVQIKHKPYIDG